MIQQVSAGIITQNHQFLISQRNKQGPMQGYWEIPGGKCEPGESAYQALIRECKEEIGIQVRHAKFMYSITHQYQHSFIQLHVYSIHQFTQNPYSKEGQKLTWLSLDEFYSNQHIMLPAGLNYLTKALLKLNKTIHH